MGLAKRIFKKNGIFILILGFLFFFYSTNKEKPTKPLPFFWHIPKCAGTTTNDFFERILFPESPTIDLPSHNDLKVLNDRLNNKLATTKNVKEAAAYCKQHFPKNKKCTNKFSLNYKNLRDTLLYLHSPFYSETTKILKLHNFEPLPVALLRHPVERFVSEYYYMKTAVHEKNFGKTDLKTSINLFVVNGKYQRNWMTCDLSQCKNDKTTRADLELAKKRLKEFKVIGFVDNVQDFIDKCAKIWGFQSSIYERQLKHLSHANKGKHKTSNFPPKTKLLIENAFSHDIELFMYAKEMFLPNYTMHTFFEIIEGWTKSTKEESLKQLKQWELKWQSIGWKTRILSSKNINHEKFKIHDLMKNIPLGDNSEYDYYCYLRYFAMASVGGGWMSDFDLIPLNLRPQEIPNAGNFTVYQRHVPSLVSGSQKEWERIGYEITNLGKSKAGKTKLFSDMMALQGLTKEKYVHSSKIIGLDKANGSILFRDDYSEEFCEKLMKNYGAHISHSAMKKYKNPKASRAKIYNELTEKISRECKNL